MNRSASSLGAVNTKLAFLLVGIAVFVAGAMAIVRLLPADARDPLIDSMQTFTVRPMDLSITLVKDGELQAVHNVEVKCQIDGQTTVQTLIDEGVSVKKGDVLMTLDSSAISLRIEETSMQLERVGADLTTAREMKQIQENQNDADLQAAEVSLTLAQLALMQFEKGTYPQQDANSRTDVETARIALQKAEEALFQTRMLFQKEFVPRTAVRNDEIAVTTAQNAVSKTQRALSVLRDYTYERNLVARRNAVAQAEQRLARTQRINASTLAQRNAEVRARERSFDFLTRRLERLQEQLAACTVRAPEDGLVVYGTSGERYNRVPLQVGSIVRREQVLFRLPGTSQMKAVVHIQEAQIPRLRLDMPARVSVVGLSEPVDATLTKMSVLPDTSQWSFNPDLREYAIELTLAHTRPEFKPGLGLTAEILIDQLQNVPVIPLSAVHSAGTDSYVFVKTGERAEPCAVQLGQMTDSYVELAGDRIRIGDRVLILSPEKGAELLSRAGIRAAPAVADSPAPVKPCLPAELKQPMAHLLDTSTSN